MKRTFILLLALLLLGIMLTGCARKAAPEASDHPDQLHIVTTIFPEYDWVRQILGDRADRADITLLLDNAVDLHSYQPTADDLVQIASCDLFIYVGGESDAWVEDALKNVSGRDMEVINLLGLLGNSAKFEETIAGMQAEAHDHEEEAEYDEHVWLSLKNALLFVDAISKSIQKIDPDNQRAYAANASAYMDQLSALDDAYQKAVDDAARTTLLFGDRFPFRYLTDDYGLSYYAAFAGCSAETEASFETISYLAGKVDALRLPCVLTIEGARHKIAETIVANTAEKNQKVLTMDSMQATGSVDAAKGATYLSIMEKNLAVLTQALN